MSESIRPTGGAAGVRLGYLFLGWLVYVAFVIYGSLVPLNFKPLPLDQAWVRFQGIPMLDLGVEHRADWLANGILYVPVGFLTVALFGGGRLHWLRSLPVVFSAIFFSFVLAVGVEFAQIFFPPRTVSRNDVIAEWIGSVLGIVLALQWSRWLHRFLAALSGRADHVFIHGVQAFAAGYLAFSFFPYDFLLSSTELGDKIRSEAWGWLIAGQSLNRGIVVLAVKLLAEVLTVVPLGLMLGRWNESKGRAVASNTWLAGGFLGGFIELVQFFVYSGVSQGVSLLTRAVGMFVGAMLWSERRRLGRLREEGIHGWFLAILIILYLLTLLAVNGAFDREWHGLAAAQRSLAQTRFLPFYYHYFTTEQAALLSLASVALMYAPVGALGWLQRWAPVMTMCMAALVASGIEATKLFLGGRHADPTDVLIAAFAAWATVRLLARLSTSGGVAVPLAEESPQPERDRLGEPFEASRTRGWLAHLATVAVAGWVATDFPFGSYALAGALLGYAMLLWRRPQFLWVAIPAALPLIDLAPWSGRFYLDELDFLIMVSVIVGYARTRPAPRGQGWDTWSLLIGMLLALTFVIGTVRGLLPWQWPDANSFTNYYSPYNALRLAKGALWAFLLAALLPRFAGDVRHLFATGMMVGLAGTVAVVVWERIAFPGLLDFEDVYRVTGPFSQMHAGGADIETFLTIAVPFAIPMLVGARSWWLRIGLSIVILGATYALMVTFSRAGYAAYALAMSVAVLFGVRIRWQQREPWRWMMPVAIVVAAVAIALPIYSGSFAQERVARSGGDLKTRVAHWQDALAMRESGLMTALFGMGLGRFPETHYWRSAEPKAGGYWLIREGDNTFLRLGAGYPLYVEQIVATEPEHEYVLRFSIRGAGPDAGVSVALCEKWLLTSGRCVFKLGRVSEPGPEWEEREIRLASSDVGTGTRLPVPVKLSFYNASPRSVDIDDVRLIGPNGESLIANGDLARGMDRWFFSTDRDLPWHVWSMPVAVLFDLGWYGVLALGATVLFVLGRSAKAAWRGDRYATAVFAALLGTLALAGVDSIIDAPRLMVLLLLILVVARTDRSSIH